MIHEISVAAFDAAGDPSAFPEAGEPLAAAQALLRGLVGSPDHGHAREVRGARPRVALRRRPGWSGRHRRCSVPTPPSIDISDYADVRREALLAHATQVDPTSPFWFGLPPEVARTVHPVDEYILARSRVGSRQAPPWRRRPGGPGPVDVEDDLFAGVRDLAAR